ncbi:hypothetical protein ACQJ0Y_14535 [Peribacillus simplex]|uniref:class III lanthionine synthetase LanKC N-terminal domain-containing protein n=1 Tax=Peribacillus simplex TaxID=1478 RepID=UPI003CF6A683
MFLEDNQFSLIYDIKKKELISKIPDFYEVIFKKHWVVFNNTQVPIPDQGWKIHLSYNVYESIEFLTNVSDVLFKLNLSWKIPKQAALLKGILLGYINDTLTGKFITIYPEDEEKFIISLSILDETIKNISQVPPVITDKKYKNSNCIFYRYGAFKNKVIYDEYGNKQSAIIDDRGKLVIDYRKPNFYKPPWINNPLE